MYLLYMHGAALRGMSHLEAPPGHWHTEDDLAIVCRLSHPNNEAGGDGLKISSATQIDHVG